MSEVKALIQKNEVSEDTALKIEQRFQEFLQKTDEWKTKAEELVVTDVNQVEEMTQAREARLVLKKIRVGADKVRKELKKDSLAYGKAVQSVYNLIESQIKPIEEHLEKQENFAKYKEIELREKLRSERSLITEQYREYIPANLDIGFMTEQEFERMIQGAKLTKKAEEEAAAKAEQERLAKEAEEAAKRKAIEEENARLKAEAAERERKHAEAQAKAEAERKALEAKVAEVELKAKEKKLSREEIEQREIQYFKDQQQSSGKTKDKLVSHKMDCRVMIIFKDYQKKDALELVKEYTEKGFRTSSDLNKDIPKGEQGYFELFKNEVFI